MTGKEVRALRDEEIKAELERNRAKLYQLRSQTVTEKVENTAQFKVVKRDIARLLTENTARRLAKAPKTVKSPKAVATAAPKAANPVKKSAAKAAGAKSPAKTTGRKAAKPAAKA